MRISDWSSDVCSSDLALGIEAAVTTAGDRRFGIALDAPPAGWRLANPEHYKGFAAAMLGGRRVRLEGEAPWLADSGLPFADAADLAVEDRKSTSLNSSH